MNSAKILSLQAMEQEEIRRDISMTPRERLELAFQLSDFARDLHRKQRTFEEPSSIPWIKLKVVIS